MVLGHGGGLKTKKYDLLSYNCGFVLLSDLGLLQVHVPDHTFTAIACREPYVQPISTARHIVAGPSVRRRPLGAVLRPVCPPRTCACAVGGVDCAAVPVELLRFTAVIDDDPRCKGGFG